MNYITCDFGGQLGNLMLEIYTVFALCKKNNIPFNHIIFDNNTSYATGGINPTKYGIKVTTNYLSQNLPVFNNIIKHFIQHDQFIKLNFNEVYTSRTSLAKIDLTNHNAILRKYVWYNPQTNDDKSLFYKLFNNETLKFSLAEKYPHYTNKNYCAVHIRRGDFLEFRNGKYIETKEQINKKLQNEFIKNSSTIFVIFSNDIKWCKDNIDAKYNVIYHSQQKGYEDLYTISLFDRVVFNPVSTFSFCAMLLNPNICIESCGIDKRIYI